MFQSLQFDGTLLWPNCADDKCSQIVIMIPKKGENKGRMARLVLKLLNCGLDLVTEVRECE